MFSAQIGVTLVLIFAFSSWSLELPRKTDSQSSDRRGFRRSPPSYRALRLHDLVRLSQFGKNSCLTECLAVLQNPENPLPPSCIRPAAGTTDPRSGPSLSASNASPAPDLVKSCPTASDYPVNRAQKPPGRLTRTRCHPRQSYLGFHSIRPLD